MIADNLSSTSGRARKSRILLPSVLLVFLTLMVYWQVKDFEFINYDDPTFTTQNYLVQKGFTVKGIREIFSNPDYFCMQLSFLSHMLDCQLFGLQAGYHHLTNLFWHIASAVLLFLFLRHMTGAMWKSLAVAMLFAIHPVHVESVAWIAERRNVLSTFFWFAALLAYWRYARQPGFLSYLAVTVLFTLGLTAKSMLVTLPFQLLLLDFWPLERIHFKSQNSNVKSFLSWVMIEKIPLFAISALACYLTLISARNQGGVKGIGGLVSFEAIPLFSRMANAAIAYINYMIHLVFPFDLSVYYPYPNSIPLWQVTGASLLLISMLIVILRYAVRLPWLVTGWFWFMGTLVPVIGLVQLGGQAMADRYIYVPSIGIFIILVWGTATIFTKTGIRRKTTALLAVFFFTILASNTWMQLQYWKNSLTLFERTVRITPDYPVAYNNLGMALANAGRLEEASDNIQKAIQLMPVFAEAYNNLGNILSTQGNIDEAVENYRKALALNPDYSEAHNNLGIAYYTKQLTEEAIFHFQQALRLSPDYPDARHNLEIVLKKRLTGK